jgi:hypothetical protein
VTIAPGASASYSIAGGTGPYAVTSSDTNVIKVSISGTTLTILGIASGTAKVAITDSGGQKVTIDVTAPHVLDTAVELFTTAPTAVTLPPGGIVTYQIGGGKAPYAVSSVNPAVVTASVNGSIVTIDALWQHTASSAPTQIAIVDALGQRVTTSVTVLGRDQTGTLPSVYPASITVSDCTSNIPFVFTGGTAPFTIYTGDNARVPVSGPLPFGPDSYFTADVHTLADNLPPFPVAPDSTTPYKVTLTVLDSQSRTATADVLIGSQLSCPQNLKLEVQAGSTVAKVSEIITFYVSGGKPPYKVTTSNELDAPQTIASADQVVFKDGQYSFDVTALSTGGVSLTGASMITVTSGDGQKKNIVLTVYPQPQPQPQP